MKEVLSWIVENYKLLILVFACILDIILFLVGFLKKKKIIPLDDVLIALPGAVALVESKIGAGNGELKKKYVLDIAKALFKESTGIELTDDSKTMKFFSSFVEEILKTPTKKEGK